MMSTCWAFLTNHAHVLLCIARDPQSRVRDIATEVGITERAAQRILADLIDDGYAARAKVGRRNNYKVNPEGHLRHPVFRISRSARPRRPEHGQLARNLTGDEPEPLRRRWGCRRANHKVAAQSSAAGPLNWRTANEVPLFA
jgi:hypothetical protein